MNKQTALDITTTDTSSFKSKLCDISERDLQQTSKLHVLYSFHEPDDILQTNITLDIESINIPDEERKKLNRDITRRTLVNSENDLLQERHVLVSKMFVDSLTKKEEIRLRYLDWQLDRIEDAVSGEHLDFFEKVIMLQENTVKELDKALDFVTSTKRGSKRYNKKYGKR